MELNWVELNVQANTLRVQFYKSDDPTNSVKALKDNYTYGHNFSTTGQVQCPPPGTPRHCYDVVHTVTSATGNWPTPPGQALYKVKRSK